jgi:hypothetical protein
LLEKVKFADTLNVKVIADAKGHVFRRDDFLIMLKKCVTSGEADQTVFVVDTLKKLASVNDKDSPVRFYNAVRPFTLAGGTLVFLAHTNEYKNEGKSVYAGTSDNIHDVDAAFSLDIISEENAEHQERIVLLECVKSRMASVPKMMFGYNASGNLKWTDRLDTVRKISDEEFEDIQNICARSRDLEIITSISETLRMDGQMQKMKLAKSVCEDTGCSRKEALAVLEKYTGSDPKKHEWNFQVGPRGAKIYSLMHRGFTDCVERGKTGVQETELRRRTAAVADRFPTLLSLQTKGYGPERQNAGDSGGAGLRNKKRVLPNFLRRRSLAQRAATEKS